MTLSKNNFYIFLIGVFVAMVAQFLSHIERSVFDGIVSVVSIGIVFSFFFTVQKTWTYWKLETETRNKVGLAFCFLVAVATICITWPGAVGVDDLYLLVNLKKGAASAFHSITYSLLISAMSFLFGGRDFTVSLLNLALYLQLLVLLFSCTRWEKKDPFFWLFLLILLMPQTIAPVFYQNRDSTYALLMLIFLFALFLKKKGRFPELQYHFATIIFLGCVLGEMRQEGKFVTLLTPFLIAYYYQKNKRSLLKVGVATAAMAGLIQWGLQKAVHVDTYDPVYQVTALINPLSHIIHVHGPQVLNAEQKEKIEKVINVEHLIQDYSPYDIVPFHKNGVKDTLSRETFPGFREVVIDLILRYPETFLESRWNFFLRLFNFTRIYDVFWDEPRFGSETGKDLLKQSGLENYTVNKSQIQKTFYEKVVPVPLRLLPQPWHFLLSSGFIPLLAITLMTVFFRKVPEFAFLAGLLLIRTLILVPLVPAELFKYVSPIWIGGWLLGLVYINQERKRIFKNF